MAPPAGPECRWGKVYFRVRHGRPRRWIGVLKIFDSEY